MPSKSYKLFQDLLVDVDRLIDTHFILSKGKKGRRALGHITRSGVVMLCAAWERFNEALLLESVDIICSEVHNINLLPLNVRKNISKYVTNHKNELKPIELTGLGWHSVWKESAKIETDLLHTPKSSKLNLLFEKYMGIEEYSSYWGRYTTQQIDEFVATRGDIAHQGSKADYVRMKNLKEYYDLIRLTCIDSDSEIALYIQTNLPSERMPWDRTY